jgi:hypothetical protein
MILEDDLYKEIDQKQALPGDIALYVSEDGDIPHSGIVVENVPPGFAPKICSKWGKGPEVIHFFYDVPEVYGRTVKYYRGQSI